MQHKLSNVVLRPSDFMEQYQEVYFRANKEVRYDDSVAALRMRSRVDFLPTSMLVQ